MDMIYFWMSAIWLLGSNALADLEAVRLAKFLYTNDYDLWKKMGKPWFNNIECNLTTSRFASRRLMRRVLFKGAGWIPNHEEAGGVINRVRYFYAAVLLGGVNMLIYIIWFMNGGGG